MIASNPVRYECHAPATVLEALEQKAAITDLLPVAGGTEVMVLVNEGHLPPRPVQSLHRLAEDWKYVRETPEGGLAIGALATYTDVRFHPAAMARWPLLGEAAKVTGAIQIQNRGTIAGNVVNGSPAADTVPVLMVYGAELVLQSTVGERRVPLEDFYTGYRMTVLRPDELIAEIILPPPVEGTRHYYRKVGTRAAQAISKVVVAGTRANGTVRLAWGSMGPTTLRTRKAEVAIAAGASPEDAGALLGEELSPMDDIRSTRAYRLGVSRNLLKEFMAKTA